jgi:glycosyltransferase involved in cell wall biosynthesis
VAFINRDRSTHPGGDLVQLDATMEALCKRGIECVETGSTAESIRGFDIAHLFHCNFNWSYTAYKAILDSGVPYVLTPIYYPGPMLVGITQEDCFSIVSGAKRVLPFSLTELDYLERELPYSLGEVTIIPNGTALEFHSTLYEGREFVVAGVSARGATDKGMDIVRRICQVENVTFVLLTGLDRRELTDKLKYSKVFVNASSSERMSLSIGEALCAGCRVLATDRNWGNEWYSRIKTFDPGDEAELRRLVRWALETPKWEYGPNDMARALTWDRTAESLERVYQQALT